MEYNFTTPHGFKVRLNPRFFMRIIKNMAACLMILKYVLSARFNTI